MPQIKESRGCLVELDFIQLPFIPRRIFYISNVPHGFQRGGHAHIDGKQIVFCVSGKVEIELRNGEYNEIVTCVNDGKGLLINEGIWAKQTYLTENTVLLVLCSHPYNKHSYLRTDN